MTEAIERLIVRALEELADVAPDEIDRDENLFASGRIDSVGIVRLIAALQRELGVTVPRGDLVPENFRTVRVMGAYLHRLRGGEGAPSPLD